MGDSYFVVEGVPDCNSGGFIGEAWGPGSLGMVVLGSLEVELGYL